MTGKGLKDSSSNNSINSNKSINSNNSIQARPRESNSAATKSKPSGRIRSFEVLIPTSTIGDHDIQKH